jgi:hypothetical protein
MPGICPAADIFTGHLAAMQNMPDKMPGIMPGMGEMPAM